MDPPDRKDLTLTDELPPPAGDWQPYAPGVLQLECALGSMWIQDRPPHCNRGDVLIYQQLHQKPGELHVSEADYWPRYCFGRETAKQQAEEWLRRHGIDPATGELVFGADPSAESAKSVDATRAGEDA